MYNFYSKGESGHRKEYIDFVSNELSGKRISKPWCYSFNKKPLLFLMIEDDFFSFLAISLIRSLFGFRTSGLTFRAHYCLGEVSLKLKIKRIILKLLRRLRNVKVISIMPFDLYFGLDKLCSNYILDFQFWDKNFFLKSTVKEDVQRMIDDVKSKSDGKIIVSAIGRQDKDKGVDVFLELYVNNRNIREKYCFVIGGKVNDIEPELVNLFTQYGGLLYNRFITNSEVCALYEISNLIWCYYSPSYDQSSGILGRTIQFSKIPIVRTGSYSEKFCKQGNISHVVLDNFMEDKYSFEHDYNVLCEKEKLLSIVLGVKYGH